MTIRRWSVGFRTTGSHRSTYYLERLTEQLDRISMLYLQGIDCHEDLD